jgi:ribosome-associated translation inhibitor RaiA
MSKSLLSLLVIVLLSSLSFIVQNYTNNRVDETVMTSLHLVIRLYETEENYQAVDEVKKMINSNAFKAKAKAKAKDINRSFNRLEYIIEILDDKIILSCDQWLLTFGPKEYDIRFLNRDYGAHVYVD